MNEEQKAINILKNMTTNYSLSGEQLHYANILYYLIINLQQQNKELHNKIDKAIEYLEEDDNFWIPDSYSEDKVKMIQDELLKILKDSDVDV